MMGRVEIHSSHLRPIISLTSNGMNNSSSNPEAFVNITPNICWFGGLELVYKLEVTKSNLILCIISSVKKISFKVQNLCYP